MGRCVSENTGPPREVDCEIPHRLERGTKHCLQGVDLGCYNQSQTWGGVRVRTLGPQERWIVRSHIGWREERNIAYKTITDVIKVRHQTVCQRQRIISVSRRFRLLQMLSKSYIGRCASEDAGLPREGRQISSASGSSFLLQFSPKISPAITHLIVQNSEQDEEIKSGTLQINWLDSKSVLTLDLHPLSCLLATGGADFDIEPWANCSSRLLNSGEGQNKAPGSAVNR
ncbi:Chromatin assembly factor 1 subunit FAS2, partial [Cucurbita argyrosperma subsp. argyrosperma]